MTRKRGPYKTYTKEFKAETVCANSGSSLAIMHSSEAHIIPFVTGKLAPILIFYSYFKCCQHGGKRSGAE